MEGKKLFLDGAQVSETKKKYIFSNVTDKGNSEKVDFFKELSMKNRDLDYDMLSSC